MQLQEIQDTNLPQAQLRAIRLELRNTANDKYKTSTMGLIELDDVLSSTQKAFKVTLNRLSEVSGNLIRRTEKLKNLGAKPSRHLDSKLIDHSEL